MGISTTTTTTTTTITTTTTTTTITTTTTTTTAAAAATTSSSTSTTTASTNVPCIKPGKCKFLEAPHISKAQDQGKIIDLVCLLRTNGFGAYDECYWGQQV